MSDNVLSREHLEALGAEFERDINLFLKLKFKNCVILHNLSLYCHFLEKETQIDLVYISERAVIVIEAKNWTGFIEGEYDTKKWTGRSRARTNISVFSPITQNDIHIRALRNALRCHNINPPYFYNIVVLPDNTTINSACKEVINKSQLVSYIQNIEAKSSYNVNVLAMKEAIREVCS